MVFHRLLVVHMGGGFNTTKSEIRYVLNTGLLKKRVYYRRDSPHIDTLCGGGCSSGGSSVSGRSEGGGVGGVDTYPNTK